MLIIKQLIQFWQIRQSKLFDRNYYLNNYPEVRDSGRNPLLHFIQSGWQKGYDPSREFDTSFYLRENHDVRQAGINPLVHYIRWGQKENRLPKAFNHLSYPNYQVWIKKYDILSERDKTLIRSRIKSFNQSPKFSLIMVVVDHSEKDVQASISSLHNQLYKKWQLIIVSRKSKFDHFSSDLIKMNNNDPKINFLASEEKPEFTKILNDIIKDSSGDYLGFIKPSNKLSQHALYLVAETLNKHPDSQILYCDEDRIDHNGNRCDPFFKPDWNPDLFLTKNYFSGLTFIKKTIIKKSGNFRFNNPDIALWDLYQRIIDYIDFQKIQHVPFVLCHIQNKRNYDNIFNNQDNIQAYKLMILSYLQRVGKNAEIVIKKEHAPRIIYHLPKPEPLVSIIIPIKDQHKLLSNCLSSIQKTSQYQNTEIIIVNNQSKDPETLEFLSHLGEKKCLIRVIEYNRPFNYSAINNFAVNETRGKVIFFLNNDTEALTNDWIHEMAGHAFRPEIGAVGAMLYYPNDTIQHAGIILSSNAIAEHAYQHNIREYKGQRFRAVIAQNISAVTGACMAIEKEKYIEVGGYDENAFPIAYNDVDLCLKLTSAGYRNLWTPHAKFYHHESVSRGYDNTPDKKERLRIENENMQKKWGDRLLSDPAYNPNLSTSRAQFYLSFPPRVSRPWLKTNE